ncbi:MAG: hypothetical protein AAF927_16410 [Bacteroidota bacterium]
MNKLIFRLILGCLFCGGTLNLAQGQNNAGHEWSVVGELGGYSRFWALALEAPIKEFESGQLDIRIGFGAQSQRWYIPGRFQYNLGRKAHKWQFNLGGTILQDLSNPLNSDFFAYFGLGTGYRYEPPQGRFWIQAGYVQLLETDPTATQLIVLPGVWRPSLELSFAYRL